MRYAVALTFYKKDSYEVKNSMTMSIQTAESENEAIANALKGDAATQNIANDYRIFWKMAIPIPNENFEK